MKYITFINKKGTEKGVDIFFAVANYFQDKQFYVLDKEVEFRQFYERAANIKHDVWIEDMSKVYNKTHLLLVPSQWADPTPRVCIEAMRYGIPVIGSAVGGIPELVGGGGILVEDYSNSQAFIDAIKRLDFETGLYEKLRKNALRHVKLFDAERIFKEFLEAAI
jgi:glycosyltransferase involved in cell wall biosynthesis